MKCTILRIQWAANRSTSLEGEARDNTPRDPFTAKSNRGPSGRPWMAIPLSHKQHLRLEFPLLCRRYDSMKRRLRVCMHAKLFTRPKSSLSLPRRTPFPSQTGGAHARSPTGPLTSPFKPREGLASRTKECFVASAGHGTMPSALPRYMPGVRVVGAGGGAGSLDFRPNSTKVKHLGSTSTRRGRYGRSLDGVHLESGEPWERRNTAH